METRVRNGKPEIKVLVRASGKHVHLCQEDLETLFGKGAALNPVKRTGADGKGDFVADKKVEVEGPKGKIMCTILGPVRKESQAEFSYTEARAIGCVPPLGESGHLDGTMGIRLNGPEGSVELEKGFFVPYRHVHLTPDDADVIGVKNGDMCDLKVDGERSLTFHDVIAKVPPRKIGMEITDVHLDYDEFNAAALFVDGVAGWLSKGDS